MSCILYYSNYCQHSKNILQILSKMNQSDFHFLCIDNRIKDDKNQMWIVLENRQKIMMPNISRVPALLLVNDSGKVLYGEQILHYLKYKQQAEVQKATNNNMEPMGYSLNDGGITSDHYCFLDQTPGELEAKGNGGMRQMHSYASPDYMDRLNINDTSASSSSAKLTSKSSEDLINKIMQQRENDLKNINGNRPPMI